MPFNRINGFYTGKFTELESQTMTIDDRNDELNKALDTRLSQLNSAIEAHEKALKTMMIPRTVKHFYLCKDILDDDGQAPGNATSTTSLWLSGRVHGGCATT